MRVCPEWYLYQLDAEKITLLLKTDNFLKKIRSSPCIKNAIQTFLTKTCNCFFHNGKDIDAGALQNNRDEKA